MKVACVCVGGQVRSVAMANYLINTFRVNAVPIAVANPFPGNFNWYIAWADKVILLGQECKERVAGITDKVLMCDVGPDIWGNPENPELKQKIVDWCEQNKGVFQ